LKIYWSSKYTALAVTPASSIDHQSPAPSLGPTFNEPASEATFQVPFNLEVTLTS
jgi:hypothetical protein